MEIVVLSFGHRYGFPKGFDLTFDLRSLPIPSLMWSLKGLTGFDFVVRSTVLGSKRGQAILGQCRGAVEAAARRVQIEGGRRLTVAIGCGGGRHRAVVVAEELCKLLRTDGFNVSLRHRDRNKHLWNIISRDKEGAEVSE